MSWKGTAIPNSGEVNSIYFNTNLSNEEVYDYLSIYLSSTTTGQTAPIMAFSVSINGIVQEEPLLIMMNVNSEDSTISKIYIQWEGYFSDIIIWSMDNGWSTDFDDSTNLVDMFKAMNPDVEYKFEAINELEGLQVGQYNEHFRFLISSTPFEELTLDSWAEDIANAIREKKGISGGTTPVSTSGNVEKVYLNTNLSNDEVKTILDSITFIDNVPMSGMGGYFIFANSSLQIGIYKYPNGTYMIGVLSSSGNVYMYNNYDSTGWQTFDNPFNVNLETLSSYSGMPVGDQNDKLVNLISTTPFGKQLIPRLNFAQEIRSIETGGGSGGLIEVDELPTENIDENAIYKIPKKFVDSYVCTNVGNNLLSSLASIIGTETVETKPTNNIVESNLMASTPEVYLYYVTSENDIFMYANAGDGLNWYSASQILALNGYTGLSFKGEYYKNDELKGNLVNETGYYAYFENESFFKSIDNEVSQIETLDTALSKFFDGEYVGKKLKLKVNSLHSYRFSRVNVDNLILTVTGVTSVGSAYNATSINSYAFTNAKVQTLYLTNIDKTLALDIDGAAFYNCGVFNDDGKPFKALILDFEEFVEVPDNAFISSAIANGTGYIYVPDHKVETVKALSGYSTYANQIKPLSEYVEE